VIEPAGAISAAIARQPWLRYEILLSLLGGYTAIAMVIKGGILHGTSLQTVLVTALFMAAVQYGRSKPGEVWQKTRLLAGYAYVLWYFWMAPSFVQLIGGNYDPILLAIDERLLGVTPAVRLQAVTSVAMTELMSGCYLSYLVYLHVALLHALTMPLDFARRLSNWIFSIYAISLAGYWVVPALGPGAATPELFDVPLVGWVMTSINQYVMRQGSSGCEVFPSLHFLITAALLEFDRRHCQRRFKAMLLPAIGLVMSTMYLRYHYAVDLIAAALLFLIAIVMFAPRRTVHVAARE
jgi:hypothetical protein